VQYFLTLKNILICEEFELAAKLKCSVCNVCIDASYQKLSAKQIGNGLWGIEW